MQCSRQAGLLLFASREDVGLKLFLQRFRKTRLPRIPLLIEQGCYSPGPGLLVVDISSESLAGGKDRIHQHVTRTAGCARE